jgi:transposase
VPVNAEACHVEATDKRLWRMVRHDVSKTVAALNLKSLKAIGLDETASKRGHNYITVLIDLDRSDKPVIFATPGKGKECLTKFCAFIEAHEGHPENTGEDVCDMSPAFLAAVEKDFKPATVTVDWLHVVQLFTKAVDDVRKLETNRQSRRIPDGPCSRVLKKGAHRTRKALFWSSSSRTSLPPRPTVSKNFCDGFGGPNQDRPPSGASPIFSSMLPNTRPTVLSWNQ